MYLVCAFKKLGEVRKRYRDNFGNLKLVRKVNVKDWR